MIQPQSSQSSAHLITYRPQQQHVGMFISGFDWRLYGTGTFRQMPRDDHEAELYLNRFVRQLGDSLHFHKYEMAYYAALEDETPGLGRSPVRNHWHFLLACPDNPYLLSCSKQLWEASNGWLEIQPYDREQSASYYINKLISDGAVSYERNLDTLQYTGPSDLIHACSTNRYVADRLKEQAFGEYLVYRLPYPRGAETRQ
jgi:hypothetical protein